MTLFVFGNAAVDILHAVPHLPRPGETLLSRGETRDFGGKGLNQAIAAARAGATVSFWSAVGDDRPGQEIRQRVVAENIDATAIAQCRGETDRSMIFVAPGGENTIVSTCHLAHSLGLADARRLVEAMAPEDILLLQGNLSKDVTAQSLTAASRRGLATLLNPAPIDFDFTDLLAAVATVIVNEGENATLSGRTDPEAGAAALLELGADTVVTTLGSAGALLTTAAGCRHIAAPDVGAVDTAGAGDVFCGVFAAATAHGLDKMPACEWAVRAAAIAVTRHGTLSAFPTAGEIAACRQD